MLQHVPVLSLSVLTRLKGTLPTINSFVDLTLGLGGHSCLVIEKFQPKFFLGIDRDLEMLKLGEERVRKCIKDNGLFNIETKFQQANFSEFDFHLPPTTSIDAALMDLGVASPHLDDPERGMSFRSKGPLDMRLDQTQDLTAQEVLHKYSEKRLGDIFREYGGETSWREAARTISQARTDPRIKIETTEDLVNLLQPILGPRNSRIHPVTKIFQALRISVNNELFHLEKALPKVIQRLTSPGGRLAVISFHSLEDAIVRRAFAEAQEYGVASTYSKNPIEAKKEELAQNPRARSAKLRILVRA